METAEAITKKAKSNLAFALLCLPKQRRRDMVLLYAFCRVIDDIADDTEILSRIAIALSIGGKHYRNQHSHRRREQAAKWNPRRQRNQLPLSTHRTDKGCRSDISNRQRFQSGGTQDLHLPWPPVGLASIKIFGCSHPNSERSQRPSGMPYGSNIFEMLG